MPLQRPVGASPVQEVGGATPQEGQAASGQTGNTEQVRWREGLLHAALSLLEPPEAIARSCFPPKCSPSTGAQRLLEPSAPALPSSP